MKEPILTLGIEEEYLLVDPSTRDLIREAPMGLLEECRRRCPGQVTPEFLQSQIEVGTRVCSSIKEAKEQLAFLRQTVAAVAADHGLAMLAASTHPFAAAGDQRHTPRKRYEVLALDLQAVARRLVICGMHVHAGIPDEDMRIEFLSQVTYFIPHLLGLSTSSPFWEGEKTGLMSYRLAVWDALPRTGLPKSFESYREYQRHLEIMVNAGLIQDASKIWWDIRPSARFPTLELRITDVCTRLSDAICLAATYRCWLRMLFRLRRSNQRWRRYSAMLLNENRWLAQRYGIDRGLVDFGRGVVISYAELMDEMLDLIAEDAEYFDCVEEVQHVRTILKRGTSAHAQIRAYDEARAQGQTHEEALCRVVDLLVALTVEEP